MLFNPLLLLLIASVSATASELSFCEVKNNYPLSNTFLSRMRDLFQPTCFFETGTYQGATTVTAATIFPIVITVELSRDLYKKNLPKFSAFNNIRAYAGDSAQILKQLLPSMRNESLMIFLDAHYSGGITAKAQEDTPLKVELGLLKEFAPQSVIIIDDVRFCQSNKKIIERQNKIRKIYVGYPSISEIKTVLHSMNPTYEFVICGDVALAYPKNLHPDIKISPTIQAMTASRFFDESPYRTASQVQAVIDAELLLWQATAEETLAIKQLINPAKKINGPALFTMHYTLWNGLIALREENYAQAISLFKKIHADFPHWRVSLYLAYAYEQHGDTQEAEKLKKQFSDKFHAVSFNV